jgi:urease accessory protein
MRMTDTASLLRLLAWLSPAFPTGGFAYSHGLEWAVEARDIHDGETLFAWLDDLIRLGSGRTDAILLHHAHKAAGDLDALAELAELGRAMSPSRERLGESTGQGNAFARAASAWNAELLPALIARAGDLPYPVAVGALGGASGISANDLCLAYLHNFTSNLISAAVRLVPLGQTAGLAALARLEPAITETAAICAQAGLDDLGGFCFRADLAAARHETQTTRLFRS